MRPSSPTWNTASLRDQSARAKILLKVMEDAALARPVFKENVYSKVAHGSSVSREESTMPSEACRPHTISPGVNSSILRPLDEKPRSSSPVSGGYDYPTPQVARREVQIAEPVRDRAPRVDADDTRSRPGTRKTGRRSQRSDSEIRERDLRNRPQVIVNVTPASRSDSRVRAEVPQQSEAERPPRPWLDDPSVERRNGVQHSKGHEIREYGDSRSTPPSREHDDSPVGAVAPRSSYNEVKRSSISTNNPSTIVVLPSVLVVGGQAVLTCAIVAACAVSMASQSYRLKLGLPLGFAAIAMIIGLMCIGILW